MLGGGGSSTYSGPQIEDEGKITLTCQGLEVIFWPTDAFRAVGTNAMRRHMQLPTTCMGANQVQVEAVEDRPRPTAW